MAPASDRDGIGSGSPAGVPGSAADATVEAIVPPHVTALAPALAAAPAAARGSGLMPHATATARISPNAILRLLLLILALL